MKLFVFQKIRRKRTLALCLHLSCFCFDFRMTWRENSNAVGVQQINILFRMSTKKSDKFKILEKIQWWPQNVLSAHNRPSVRHCSPANRDITQNRFIAHLKKFKVPGKLYNFNMNLILGLNRITINLTFANFFKYCLYLAWIWSAICNRYNEVSMYTLTFPVFKQAKRPLVNNWVTLHPIKTLSNFLLHLSTNRVISMGS